MIFSRFFYFYILRVLPRHTRAAAAYLSFLDGAYMIVFRRDAITMAIIYICDDLRGISEMSAF